MHTVLEAYQPLEQVSCTVAGCLGCDWEHNRVSGRRRFYTTVRIPKWWFDAVRVRLGRRNDAH